MASMLAFSIQVPERLLLWTVVTRCFTWLNSTAAEITTVLLITLPFTPTNSAVQTEDMRPVFLIPC